MASQLRCPLVALFLFSAAGMVQGQTVTWVGGFPDDNFSTASNWAGGVAPANDGSEGLIFTDNSSQALILDIPANFSTVTVQPVTNEANMVIFGAGPLTIGSGGIYVQSVDEQSSSLTINSPVVLGATQSWAVGENPSGSLTVNGAITASMPGFGLTLTGDDFMATFTLSSSASTFDGGVYLMGQNSVLVLGSSSVGGAPGAPVSGPVGTGTLQIGDGTQVTVSNGTPVTLANTLQLGDNTSGDTIKFGGPDFETNFESNLTFTGPVTIEDPSSTLYFSTNTIVAFSNNIAGAAGGTNITLESNGEFLNSIAIFQGNFSNIANIDIADNLSVILDGSSIISGTSQLGGMTSIAPFSSTAYLGLGAAYASPGFVTQFMSFMNSSGSAPNYAGTLGFDTTTGSVGALFDDPIDLTNFTAPGFAGLGSATIATLGVDAIITPPHGSTGTTYPFGGGGGTLTVLSPLGNAGGPPHNLNLTQGGAALTLVLSGPGGNLSYTGGTSVEGAALIFDTALPPSGPLTLGGGSLTFPGYIGSTTNSNYSDANSNIQNFINLFPSGSNGVIGFDVIGGGTRTVSSSLNLNGFGSGVYLGSATSVDFTGGISNAPGGVYQFAGVKGGQVNVDFNLTTPSTSVVLGLENVIESYNTQTGSTSISSVTMSGNNQYTGGTTLNSGYLFVTNDNSIGYGPLIVPSSSDFLRSGWIANLSTVTNPVTLDNTIEVPDAGLALNLGGGATLTLAGNIVPYGGQNGQIGIYGPVVLSGTNTYAGGTVIGTATVTIASDTGFGTGSVTANNSTLNFTSPAPTLASDPFTDVSLTGTTATFAGSPTLNELSMAESTLNFNGSSATINGFFSDAPGSGNVISLAASTELTIDTNNPNDESNGATYYGTISGAAGSNLFVTGGGSLDLRNANTYPGGTTIDTNSVVIASNNMALGTGAVTLSSGAALATNNGITLTNPITLGPGSELAGFGTFSPGGTLLFNGGVAVDPGRGNISNGGGAGFIPIPGKLSFGTGTNVNFGQGGAYLFSITDANGPAGTGFGTVSMPNSTLTISATMAQPFNIFVFSYDPTTNQAGLAQNFNPVVAYSWTLVSAQSIVGFNSNFFNVTTANFQNDPSGTFSVGKSGNDLTLDFTPVPEPSTWVLVAGGMLALGGAAWRRRRL
jgi:hypothetical protein